MSPSLRRCSNKESVVVFLLVSYCFLKPELLDAVIFRKIFFCSLVFVCLISALLPVSDSLVNFQSLVQQVKT